MKREPIAEPSRCLVEALSSEREYSELGTRSGPYAKFQQENGKRCIFYGNRLK